MGASLLDRVEAALRRFVAFPDKPSSVATALWVVHTHAFHVARATPYLNVYSPAPRCGKSTLFEVLALLVREPVTASNASPAVLYRVIDRRQPTLLLDEVDAQLKSDREKASAFQPILNSGYRAGPGATVLRCDGDQFVPRAFNTFCPKAFAGIGRGNLHDTTMDRCIRVRLERKLAAEDTERFRPHRFEPEAAELKGEIEGWFNEHAQELEDADPNMPDALADRAQEIWEPLIAIADLAGGEWSRLARRAALALSTEPDFDDMPLGLLMLKSVQIAFDNPENSALSTDELVNRLLRMHDTPWPNWSTNGVRTGVTPRTVAGFLRSFGIRPRTIRLPGDEDKPTRKGYRREWCEDAWTRYLADYEHLGESEEEQEEATEAEPTEAQP